MLIQKGANVNFVGQDQDTPFTWAAASKGKRKSLTQVKQAFTK